MSHFPVLIDSKANLFQGNKSYYHILNKSHLKQFPFVKCYYSHDITKEKKKKKKMQRKKKHQQKQSLQMPKQIKYMFNQKSYQLQKKQNNIFQKKPYIDQKKKSQTVADKFIPKLLANPSNKNIIQLKDKLSQIQAKLKIKNKEIKQLEHQIIKQSNNHSKQQLISLNQKVTEKKSQGMLVSQHQKFEIGIVLSQGNFACVTTAKDIKNGNMVVLKTYYKYKILDQKIKNSVIREIKFLKKFNHPNIIILHSNFTTKFGIHLVMQYMPYTLKQFIYKNRLTQKQKQNIILQLIQAIQYIHLQNIVHRDIKLQNILINDQKIVKLIDFGFSSYQSPLTVIFINQKVLIGTLSYIAPEILARQMFMGKPADIWALGVLFYKILQGHFPYKSTNEQLLLLEINNKQLKLESKHRGLLRQMLRKNPKQRPTIMQVRQYWSAR